MKQNSQVASRNALASLPNVESNTQLPMVKLSMIDCALNQMVVPIFALRQQTKICMQVHSDESGQTIFSTLIRFKNLQNLATLLFFYLT